MSANDLPRQSEQQQRGLLPVELGGESYGFKREPRCRVCNHSADFVVMVNKLLIGGESYAETFRQVIQYDKRKKPVTFSSVWKHGQRHIPSSSAAVRKIIEERSERMNRDFVHSTQNLLDEYIYTETLMRKAFETMTVEGAEVSAKDGLEAAKFIHSIKAGEENNQSLTGVLTQLSEIINAVKTTVPEAMWDDIVTKLDGGSKPAIVPSEIMDEDEDDDEEAFDPAEVDLDRDELEN